MGRRQSTLADMLLMASIVLLAALALVYTMLLLVDRQITHGVTYKEVDLAAWIQAIGSVVAILSAYFLSSRQAQADRRLEEFRRAQDDIRRLRIIDTLLGNFERHLAMAHQDLDTYKIPIGPRGLFLRDALHTVRAIDLFSCPSTKVIDLLAIMQPQFEGILASIDAYDRSFDELRGDTQRERRGLWNGLNLLRSIVGSTRQAISKSIADLDAL